MHKHAYFDLDGTLTDPFEGIAKSIAYALDKLGEPVPDDAALRSWIGPPLLASFEAHVGAGAGAAGLALDHYRERFGDIGWRENRPCEGIDDALAQLVADGWQLYVATTKPQVFADQIVDHFELSGFFAGIFGSGLDGTRADKSELLRYAKCVNAPADIAAMIGDREHDMLGARSNDMIPVGVAYGFGSVDELERAGALAIAARPSDIPLRLAECKLSS